MVVMLPIYDRQGTLVGFVKEPRHIGVSLQGGCSLFKPGQILRVRDVNPENQSILFEVLEEPAP